MRDLTFGLDRISKNSLFQINDPEWQRRDHQRTCVWSLVQWKVNKVDEI